MSARTRARHVLAALAVLTVAAVGLAHDAAAASPSPGPTPSCATVTAPTDGTAGALAAAHGVDVVGAAVVPPAHSFASHDGPADYVVALAGADGRVSVWGLAYLDPEWVDTAYPVGDVARELEPGSAHLWIPASGVHDHTLVTGLAAACAGGAS